MPTGGQPEPVHSIEDCNTKMNMQIYDEYRNEYGKHVRSEFEYVKTKLLTQSTNLAVVLVFCSKRQNSKMNGDGDVALIDWLINTSVCIG